MKKTLILMITAVFCILSIFSFTGCAEVEQKVAEVKSTINQVVEALDKVEEVSDEINQALEDAEAKVDELQTALDDAETKIDEFNEKIEKVEAENLQLRKEINCLKNIHYAKDATYEWSGNSCTATGVCEICGTSITETVTAIEVDGVLTATFSLNSGFGVQTFTAAE